MAKKTLSVEVSANTHDVVSSLVGLAVKVKGRLDDGFQLEQDLAALLPELIALGGVITQMGQVDDELKEDAGAWALALLTGAAPLAEMFKKEEQPAQPEA
jgi:hypothetical protein